MNLQIFFFCVVFPSNSCSSYCCCFCSAFFFLFSLLLHCIYVIYCKKSCLTTRQSIFPSFCSHHLLLACAHNGWLSLSVFLSIQLAFIVYFVLTKWACFHHFRQNAIVKRSLIFSPSMQQQHQQ